MELNRATAILKAAKEYNIYGEPIPEDEDKLLEEAEAVVAEARAYHKNNPDSKAVNAVLFAADVVGGSEGEDYEVPKTEPVDTSDLSEVQANALAKIQADNLPIPHALHEDPPTLPNNLGAVSTPKLQELLSQASACLSLATWRTSLAEVDEERAKKTLESYIRKAYAKVVGDAKNKDEAYALADEDPKVIEWRAAHEISETEYTMYRSLKDIYKGQWDTISRIFAMRQEENKR